MSSGDPRKSIESALVSLDVCKTIDTHPSGMLYLVPIIYGGFKLRIYIVANLGSLSLSANKNYWILALESESRATVAWRALRCIDCYAI